MAASYVVRPLSPSDAAEGARAWNELADGTLAPETVARIESLLGGAGGDDFAAFGAEANGRLRGIATARVSVHPLDGRRGEIEALMIDGRLPDEAGDALAHLAIQWLRARAVTSISHLRDVDARGARSGNGSGSGATGCGTPFPAETSRPAAPIAMTTEQSIAGLAELIAENQPCVALTGAGVSTESGIPDFRSPTGIWAEFDPLEYGSLSAFQADPEKVWRFYAPRFSLLTDAEPNAAHRALAELERAGLLRAVITQNIDLLHERAGSHEVVEVHGSIRRSTCLTCDAHYSLEEVVRLLEAEAGAPRCAACGAVVKPDVVFFEELLPEGAIERAYALAGEARLLLVVGSSLEVWPVAELPFVTLRAGGKVAVINEGPTSVDDRAALKLAGKAGEMLGGAVARLAAHGHGDD